MAPLGQGSRKAAALAPTTGEAQVQVKHSHTARAFGRPEMRPMVPMLCCLAGLAMLPIAARAEPPALVVVDLAPGKHRMFDPASALGIGIDGVSAGDSDRLLTPGNIAAVKASGLQSFIYRLRTELGIETWHWNPVGQWSDPVLRQGYWTSSDTPAAPIQVSWGYRLPRRGDSVDQANDEDYSRLTDGDESSFWKSNPYLNPAYLRDGQPHWQWLVVRLDAMAQIDTIRIAWGDPYAIRFAVQYWTSDDEYDDTATWTTFPFGRKIHGKGGLATLRLTNQPITAKFVRVLLKQGSHTAAPGASDWRDKAGFAVREVSLGRTGPDGQLIDLVHHVPSGEDQTFTRVSSTDPWHRDVDRDDNTEQPGLDRVFANGLGNGRPILLPMGLLYDTPDNAAAELRYLHRRGYLFHQVELGEEPDGQYGEAADYGALYLALVDRLKPANPGIIFGGPSLQSAFTDLELDPAPDHSWNGHFMRYLKARGRMGDLGFFSFEHFPFDDICGDIHAKLLEENNLMRTAITRLAAEGVPRHIPWVISEYGFSAFAGRAMSEMPSALLMADIIGQFLGAGGGAVYMYGYGPDLPMNEALPCNGFGNMMLYSADVHGQVAQPMPSFEAARLITHGWLVPGGGQHELLPSTVRGVPGEWVKSYVVRRPDHRLGVLLINRSPTRAFTVRLMTRNRVGRITALHGPASVMQYGPAQYAWQDDGADSHPSRSEPPSKSRLSATSLAITLPPESLTVVARALVAAGN